MSEGTVRRPRSGSKAGKHPGPRADTTGTPTPNVAPVVPAAGHADQHKGHKDGRGAHPAHDTLHGPKGGRTPNAAALAAKGGHGPRTHVEDYYMQQIPFPHYTPQVVAHIDDHYLKRYNIPSSYSRTGYDKKTTHLVCYNSHKNGSDGLPSLSALVARKLKRHEDYRPTNEVVAHEGDLKKFKWAICKSQVVDPDNYPQNNLLLYMSTENVDLINTLLKTNVGDADAARKAIFTADGIANSKPHLWVTRSWTGKRSADKESVSIGFVSMLIPCNLQDIDRVYNPVTQRDSLHGNVLQTFGLVKPALENRTSVIGTEEKWQDFKKKYGAHIFCTNINEKFEFQDSHALHVFDTYLGVIAENTYAACWYDKSLEHSDIQLCRKSVQDQLHPRVHPTHCHFLTVVNQHMIRNDHKPLGVRMVQDMYTDICNKYNELNWRNFEKEHEKKPKDFVKDMHLHYLLLLFFYAHNKPVTAEREKKLTHLLESSEFSFEEIGVVPNATQRKEASKRNWLKHNPDDIVHDLLEDRGEDYEEEKKEEKTEEEAGTPRGPNGSKPTKVNGEYPSDSTDMLRKWT